ncbi:hypothetical protein K7640_02090 [Micromonospora sp. PLK6-60]|uniref:hypothetical protein n=1 Tax=Micromonospora sp. PLK6-60 TaxID=2873383 RepID=UPI001CA617FE|nr:hypothetical protein [Micromonospora sp. PLK6-60]MBY8870630.1 hypothetical protein [Micromonospora sp. PLK6-60]
MEITSGGTPGPRLAGHLWEMDNNLYGRLPERSNARSTAEVFVRAGWRAVATSWTECRIEHEWAEFDLLQPAAGGLLLSGVVEPSRLDDLGAVLAGLGWRFELELWSDDGPTLLREIAG